MPKRWELTVDGRLENLASIADFVIKAAQSSGLDERATFEVQMAVDEACTNVIQHSYGGGREGRNRPPLRACGRRFRGHHPRPRPPL
ncbi:MAG: ATP-binding protein [Anaerolineae bacterium]